MQMGSQSAEVSNLQTFLAADSSVYPSGLVTGYYGALTAAAVTQFQVNYSLSQVGRVGPLTLVAINKINASGLALDSVTPTIYNVLTSSNLSNETISWNTNKLASGALYYSVSGIQSNETTQGYTYPYVSGTLVSANGGSYSTNQSVTLTGLTQGATYYFLIESVDASGNLSVTMPSSFIAN
jgi:peptidoglycan hydrolase-like protein with peptidoglycan-binding domain